MRGAGHLAGHASSSPLADISDPARTACSLTKSAASRRDLHASPEEERNACSARRRLRPRPGKSARSRRHGAAATKPSTASKDGRPGADGAARLRRPRPHPLRRNRGDRCSTTAANASTARSITRSAACGAARWTMRPHPRLHRYFAGVAAAGADAIGAGADRCCPCRRASPVGQIDIPAAATLSCVIGAQRTPSRAVRLRRRGAGDAGPARQQVSSIAWHFQRPGDAAAGQADALLLLAPGDAAEQRRHQSALRPAPRGAPRSSRMGCIAFGSGNDVPARPSVKCADRRLGRRLRGAQRLRDDRLIVDAAREKTVSQRSGAIAAELHLRRGAAAAVHWPLPQEHAAHPAARAAGD